MKVVTCSLSKWLENYSKGERGMGYDTMNHDYILDIVTDHD